VCSAEYHKDSPENTARRLVIEWTAQL
jgi:hypothetical protein